MFGAVSFLSRKVVTLTKWSSAFVASGLPTLLLVFMVSPNINGISFLKNAFESISKKIFGYTKEVKVAEKDLYLV